MNYNQIVKSNNLGKDTEKEPMIKSIGIVNRSTSVQKKEKGGLIFLKEQAEAELGQAQPKMRLRLKLNDFKIWLYR